MPCRAEIGIAYVGIGFRLCARLPTATLVQCKLEASVEYSKRPAWFVQPVDPMADS